MIRKIMLGNAFANDFRKPFRRSILENVLGDSLEKTNVEFIAFNSIGEFPWTVTPEVVVGEFIWELVCESIGELLRNVVSTNEFGMSL